MTEFFCGRRAASKVESNECVDEKRILFETGNTVELNNKFILLVYFSFAELSFLFYYSRVLAVLFIVQHCMHPRWSNLSRLVMQHTLDYAAD